MKKAILLISCLMVCFSSTFAQTPARKTFRVYKHDGTKEVFSYSRLDSITFSEATDPDALSETILIQNFHTPDSTYRFSLNDIDSVSFTPIPTVYNTATVRIDGRLRDYVIGSDSLTLFVKKSIPNDLLPRLGVNIATLECDDILPYGFMGKVEKIITTDDKINIECSQPSLIEIFKSVEISGTASTTEPTSPSRAPLDNSFIHHSDVLLPAIKHSINIEKEIEMGKGFSGTYDMTAYEEFSTPECIVNWALLVEPMAFQMPQVYYSFTLTAQNNISIGASLSSSIKWKKEIPLEIIRNIRIPGAVSLFEIFEEAGIFIEISGEIALNGSLTRPYTTLLHFTLDNKSPAVIPPTFKMISHDPINETTLEGSAAISVGLYGKLGIAPLVKEFASLEAGFKTGATFSSSIDFSPAATPLETLNTEMYEELDRDDFFRGDFFLTGEVAAKISNETSLSRSVEIGDLLIRNPFFKRGIVPHFNEVSLTESSTPSTLTASAKMNRQLMFKTPVGFALYDSNKKLVDSWWSPQEYLNTEGTTITHDFEGLSANKTYILHPITRAFKDNMVANPSSEAKIVPQVTTEEASAITQQSATIHGSIQKIDVKDDCSYGFIYWAEQENGQLLTAVMKNGEKSFSADLSDLSHETEYYYKAFAVVNQDTIWAEKALSFKTLEDIEIDATNNIWTTPTSVIFVFPNVSEDETINISISIYSDFEMKDQLIGGMQPGYFRNDPRESGIAIYNYGRLKPSTSYWYKIRVRNTSIDNNEIITGSFNTTASITVATPDLEFDTSEDAPWNNPNFNGQHFNDNTGRGYYVKDSSIYLYPPSISGINSSMNDFLLKAYPYGFSPLPSIGIIYSDSPDKLTFLSQDDKTCIWGTAGVDGISGHLHPGTYYYRAYYTDVSGYRLTHDGDKWIAITPNGEILGEVPVVGLNETVKKMNHLSTVYGEIKQIVIPEKFYYYIQ